VNGQTTSPSKIGAASAPSYAPPLNGLLQRKCTCGNHAVAGGECAECAKNKSGLQRKLAIGSSNDPLEREADRVADRVMATPAHSAVSAAPPRIQRYAGQATEGMDTAPVSVDRVLANSGRPLEPALQQDMERRFGHDFSGVRVHSGAAAEQSARDVNANAYTVGHNIVFGTGQFAPGTHKGRRLITHELTHVVQQSSFSGGPATAARPQIAPFVQRQIPFAEPWVRPIPMPRIGPMPRVGPVPEIGPLPPIVVPMPGDFDPELEVEDLPEDEEIEVPEGSSDPQPEPEAEPPAAEAKPQLEPKPVPPIAPNPAPEDEKEDQNVCGSKRMPLTKVSWSPGPLGQAGTVRASPLTRCPGNTIGSQAKASTYLDQFRCIKKAGLSRTWLPLHLLHGVTRRSGPRNLHGPGNERWNITIGDPKLNGDVYKAVEDLVINRLYDWNQVLWLESKVVDYFPGAEFFAKKITLAWGIYNTVTNSEVATIGGGTFENDPKNLPPPSCAPTSRAGAAAVAAGAASAFDTTISICKTTLKSKQPFPVTSGGLELTLRARAQGPNCNIGNYSVALWKSNKNWIDGEFGSKTVPAGKAVKLRWRNLPPGDYYFVFTVGPHDPNCCLKGDMSVRTFSATGGVPWA
jgi:hypothetical protein